MLKRTILAVSVAALTFTGVVRAQENATLTLRSGERINAQLVDMGGVGFTVRINGTERQIPTNDVAVIDFTGGTMSDADWSRIANGQQVALAEERRHHQRPALRYRRLFAAAHHVQDQLG